MATKLHRNSISPVLDARSMMTSSCAVTAVPLNSLLVTCTVQLLASWKPPKASSFIEQKIIYLICFSILTLFSVIVFVSHTFPNFPATETRHYQRQRKKQTKYLQADKHWCIQQTSKQEHPWCTDVMTKQPHNLKCQKKTSTASTPNGDDIVLDTSRSQSKDYIWSNIDIAFS